MNEFSTGSSGNMNLRVCPNIPSPHSWRNKAARVIWALVYLLAFRCTPRWFHGWRCMLLRLFGAKIGCRVHVAPSARFWLPANLRMGDDSCLAEGVNCYNVAEISIGANTTVSQFTFLCTASHDIERPEMPLIVAPILICDQAWVAAEAFIAMGVMIGQGAVVGARAVVTKEVAPWTVVAGNPARNIKKRKIVS